jgi:hypothetical protein
MWEVALPDDVTYIDLAIEPDGQSRWRVLSDGEVIARGVDYLKAIHIALKRVRRVAVGGKAAIQLRGMSCEEELQDRLAEAAARWRFPPWWLNCEWHIV